MKRDAGARSGSSHVNGSAPDEIALVIPGGHGTVLAEVEEGPLNDVALLVRGCVEGGRPSAFAAAPEPVAGLVRGFGIVALIRRPRSRERIAVLE